MQIKFFQKHILSAILLIGVFLLSSIALGQEGYAQGLSSREVEKNYEAINTRGVYTSVEEVPNVKVTEDRNVCDPHNMLTAESESEMQAIIDQLYTDKDYEMMVVCLNSIEDNPPRDFGTALFNLWGVGDKDTENGLIILVINDVHRVEFITGRGLETILTDVECYDIQQEYMVPFFKENDYVTGVLRGVRAVNDDLRGKQVLFDEDPDDINSQSSGYYDYSYEPDPWYMHPLFIRYCVIAGILSLLYAIFLIIAVASKDLHFRYRVMRLWTLWIYAFIYPLPFIFLVYYTRKASNRWRNMERVGLKSGDLLHKLSEEEEDQHLSQGQISEEIVKSIDYDVWINDAGDDIVILAYKSWFTKYNKCDHCGYKTYFKEYDKIISSATYSSSGKGEKKYKCQNCGHTKIKRYTIPRKQRTHSGGGYYSSGGGSFGGGGGSFGGGGGLFGGGGGLFGGGGSRGGGAGSSW